MKNIGEAFTFVFKDPEWLTKLLIGALFTLLSVFIIGIPVLYGYYVELLQRVRRGERYPLPEWKDVGVKFVIGVKYLVTVLVYYLPILIIVVPFVILPFIIFITIAEHDGMHVGEFFQSIAMIVVLALFVVPLTLFVTIVTPIISIEFARYERIDDGLQVGRVLKLFGKHWQDAVVAVLISYAMEITASIGIVFFLVGILFTSFYVSLIKFHLFGQIGQAFSEPESVSA